MYVAENEHFYPGMVQLSREENPRVPPLHPGQNQASE